MSNTKKLKVNDLVEVLDTNGRKYPSSTVSVGRIIKVRKYSSDVVLYTGSIEYIPLTFDNLRIVPIK